MDVNWGNWLALDSSFSCTTSRSPVWWVGSDRNGPMVATVSAVYSPLVLWALPVCIDWEPNDGALRDSSKPWSIALGVAALGYGALGYVACELFFAGYSLDGWPTCSLIASPDSKDILKLLIGRRWRWKLPKPFLLVWCWIAITDTYVAWRRNKTLLTPLTSLFDVAPEAGAKCQLT